MLINRIIYVNILLTLSNIQAHSDLQCYFVKHLNNGESWLCDVGVVKDETIYETEHRSQCLRYCLQVS